ncbi:MAG: type II secretion system protein [Phycisphaerales bacterium]
MKRARHNVSRAFTISELLVSIGVIGVLIAITLPALRSSRAVTGATASLANLRSLGQSLQLSTQRNNERFPFPPRRGESWGPLYWEPPHPNAAQHFYGDVWYYGRFFWPALLHDVAPWPEHYASWLSPNYQAPDGDNPLWERVPIVSYFYSTAFYAAPRVWDVSLRANVTAHDIAQQPVSVVSFPSAKVIAYDRDRSYITRMTPDAQRPVLFVDGSASLRLDRDAAEPVQNPLSADSPARYHDTPLGAAGRDF